MFVEKEPEFKAGREKRQINRIRAETYHKKYCKCSFEACNKDFEKNPPKPAAVFSKNLHPQNKKREHQKGKGGREQKRSRMS